MGLAKRARLSAALTAPSDLPPAADLSTIRIVRRDKGPASVIALADNRPAADGAAKPAGDGMFYKKGSATAATFRPAYWSYEPDPSQLAGPVASLEQQLDARRRSTSPATAPIEAKAEEKPLASLDAAPAIRKLAPSAEPSPPVPDPPTPTRASHERAELDREAIAERLPPVADQPTPTRAADERAKLATEVVAEPLPPVADLPTPTRAADERAELDSEAVEALLRPMPEAAPVPAEVPPTPAVVEAVPSTPDVEAMPSPLAPLAIREEPAVLPAELSPPDDPPLALPVAPPPSAEVPVAAAPSPPASASVASESAAPSDPPATRSDAERSRPSAAPARKRPSQEAAKRAEPESAELDELGAAIDSVLATRWYGGDRSGLGAGRVTRADIAPVTPSGLIAELATLQKEPEAVPPPSRGRRVRIIAALSLVAAFALAFAAALLWRTGHGAMLPTRFLPALFSAASTPEAAVALADNRPAAPEQVARS
jgi:hypothetical protein